MAALPDFFRGDTYVFSVEHPGVDVTGWLFTWTLKSAPEDATPALQVQHTAGSGPLDDAVNGVVFISLDSVTSAGLTPGSFVCDVERRIPGSPPLVRTLVHQKIRVLRDVTD